MNVKIATIKSRIIMMEIVAAKLVSEKANRAILSEGPSANKSEGQASGTQKIKEELCKQFWRYPNHKYYTDPSGTFWQCNAKAIGSGSEGADSSLQEQYNKDLTLKEAETIALSILKQVMEEKVTPNNVDIAKVAPTYHLYSPSEVEQVISRL
ncbi:proteasome subunit alpha type-5 [Olea europaea subsp. europaea]|uniref:Proteasome subunit alpha type-5 n=1 Tax=Olea europaea subsp. europaea TaxID=158383 RepID=A0A8S0SFI4_OLEEU|nr:proteasome subunit alpha type-5 [Olea europaea subsp. europaea]